jgi:hypothetical protein
MLRGVVFFFGVLGYGLEGVVAEAGLDFAGFGSGLVLAYFLLFL